MSIRELQLQGINKTLQSKIITLKEEQKIVSERYENKMKIMAEEHSRILAQKEKTIEYLRGEIDKNREMLVLEQHTFDSCRHKEKIELYSELDKYRGKCADLEKRVQSITEKYQMKNKELEDENLRFRQVISELHNSSRQSLHTEIDKLTKYYQTSRVEQSRRKQNIEWIDKLVAFMDRFDNESDKAIKESLSFLQISVENLKQDIIGPMKVMSQQEEGLAKERKTVISTIHQIVEEQVKITRQAAEENEKLLELMKKQRQSQQTERIASLQKQLAAVNQRNQDESNQLAMRIKQLQTQRKTLLLGFTELKTLNESREKTYRDEIVALKGSIEELLGGIEIRESQFEKQVQALHQQLTNLNQRYYQNIEVPLHNISGKIELQLRTARQELQKLADNKGFIKLIQNLETILQKYVNQQAVSNKLSFQLTQYSRKAENLIIIGSELLEKQRDKKYVHHYQSEGKSIETQENVLIMLQGGTKDVEWRQKESRLNYQITTLKKQNKKLKDQNVSLQNQLYQRSSSPFKCKHQKVSCQPLVDHAEKIMQLQAENEKLKGLHLNYQEEFMYQIKVLKESIKKMASSESKENNSRIKFKEDIRALKDYNQKILPFLDRENSHIKAVRETLGSLNRILIKPVQVFDEFIGMIGKCYTPLQNYIAPKTEHFSSFVPFQKLQAAYNEVNVKRQQNAISTNRLSSELIKTLRQSIPLNIKSKVQLTQPVEQKLQRARGSREGPLQKKIKQLMNQKIKNRQQVNRKFQKIEQSLKSMQQKMGKRGWNGVSRLQEVLDRKLIELSQRYMLKTAESANELSNITTSALKQLKNKLRTCMSENENLIKQMQYITVLRKQAE